MGVAQDDVGLVSSCHPHWSALQDFDDPHLKLMSTYEEVPDLWYIVVSLSG